MSISDGQRVEAATDNPAFMSRTDATTSTVAKVALNNPAVESGPDLFTNIQRVLNRLNSATNVNENTLDGKVYSDPAGVLFDTDNHVQSLLKLAAKLHQTTGHGHTGAVGDGPVLTAYVLTSFFLGIFGAGIAAQIQFAIANAQASPADITGLVFDKDVYSEWESRYTLWRRDDTEGRRESGRLIGRYDYFNNMWHLDVIVDATIGAFSGVAFTIDPTTGQAQYTSTNMAGGNHFSMFNHNVVYTFEKEV